MTRLAIVHKDACKPRECSLECIKYCPVNRTGNDCITIPENSKIAIISESMCNGCAICVKKCPLDAIDIINLPRDLDDQISHRYGQNQFKLHRLPIPKKGRVVGLVGQNGSGKSTSINILAGNLKPNLGMYDKDLEWEDIIDHYKGNELQNYFSKIASGEFKIAFKPQNVERIPKFAKGKVSDLLLKADERGMADEIKIILGLEKIWDRKLSNLSGGEIQRLAIAATVVKDADAYFFDEPTSFLDIKERMKVSNLIRTLVEKDKMVVIVEHDLAILDYLSDVIHLYYGTASAYGIVTFPLSVRQGINIFLDGYIPVENMRFRDTPIIFKKSSLSSLRDPEVYPLITYGNFLIDYTTFKLEANAGAFYQGDIVGIIGPNGIGKTAFAKIIAGVEEPAKIDEPIRLIKKRVVDEDEEFDENEKLKLVISYKPQYLNELTDSQETVEEILRNIDPFVIHSSFYRTELLKPLKLDNLMAKRLENLSGGELQKVAIAKCLAKNADIYIIDEPSAYISSEDRVAVSKAIRRIINHRKSAGIVIEHDLMLQAYISDRIIHFTGERGVHGQCTEPKSVKDGMNSFLKSQSITLRSDQNTGRPRVNKLNSKLDKMQKSSGNYFKIN